MMNRSISAAALFFFAGILVFAANEPRDADRLSESDGAGLEIRSEPSGADVYVNDVLRGTTPIALPTLISGAQRVRIEKDGYLPREALVVIPKGKRLSLFLELAEAKGILTINASPEKGNKVPFAPEVLIDGETAQLGDNEVSEGLHSVRVRAFGFEDEARSIFVRREFRETIDFTSRTAPFRIASVKVGRTRFNPQNPGKLGSTTVDFTVSAPGNATVSVRADDGTNVFAERIASFRTWNQSAEWRGEDSDGRTLPDGDYVITVTARSSDGEREEAESVRVSIDSRLDIRPAAVSGNTAGLTFAPGAKTLPRGSFQIESTAVFGRPYGVDSDFGPPPASFGLRWAPFDRTEASATAELDADTVDSARLSFGLSLKRALFASRGNGLFALSAALRWSSAATGASSAFGAAPAVEFALPAEIELARFPDAAVSALIAPSLLWSGSEGIPDRVFPFPAISWGAIIKGKAFSAGLSARTETEADGGALAIGPSFVAAEARFFPPPSIFVFSALCGGWFDGGNAGLFAGGGLGIVY